MKTTTKTKNATSQQVIYSLSNRQQPPQNEAQHDINIIAAITQQVAPLLDLTYKLKCAAYKFANLPTNNLKSKVVSSSQSLLTSIESIFYDLKRVQTILNESGWSRNNNNRGNYVEVMPFSSNSFHKVKKPNDQMSEFGLNNYDSNVRFNDTFMSPKFGNQKYGSKSEVGGLNELSPHNFKSKQDLRQTIKVNLKSTANNHHNHYYGVENNTKGAELRALYSGKSKETYNSPDRVDYLPIGKKNIKIYQQQSERISENHQIKKVASLEYLKRDDNNNLSQKIKQSMLKPIMEPDTIVISPKNSDRKSKIASDWEDLYMQDLILQQQNEEFLRKMQRERQGFLKFINRKNKQCIGKINQLKNNQKRNQSRGSRQSRSFDKSFKRRSRTQKLFAKSQMQDQSKILDNINFLNGSSLNEGVI